MVARNGGTEGLEGRVAIVTGASSGVGRAYALALAARGATVIGAARSMGSAAGPPQRNTLDEVVRAATSSASSASGRVLARVCDLSVEADVVRLVAETITNHGRIDVLVNNAAILTNFDTFAVGAEDWDQIMKVNVRAAYLMVRETAPHMMRRRAGSVINITSRAAELTPQTNFAKTLPYAVSKAALNKLTYFLAAELAPYGIAVNALTPGLVASDNALAATDGLKMSGPFKPATPGILGPALSYLAMQTADDITGQVLQTDEFGRTWPADGAGVHPMSLAP